MTGDRDLARLLAVVAAVEALLVTRGPVTRSELRAALAAQPAAQDTADDPVPPIVEGDV